MAAAALEGGTTEFFAPTLLAEDVGLRSKLALQFVAFGLSVATDARFLVPWWRRERLPTGGTLGAS